ncbi:hypothetical protein BH23ACT2_BH23ACT2_17410 [soil metagenome]
MAFVGLDGARTEVLGALEADQPVGVGPTRPAIERYRGVLYQELDAGSLRGAARRRLHRRVLVVSGLWGLVAPADPIPDYKLKMGTRLGSLGRLSTWWRPRLTEALVSPVRGAVVWDLLPNEHAAALDWDALAPRNRITVRFVDRRGRAVSHWNKLLKGSIVRWLAETGVTDPATLGDFRHPRGYRLDTRSSVFADRTTALVLREGVRGAPHR